MIGRAAAQSCFPPFAPLPTGEGTLFQVVARGPERVYLLLGERVLPAERRGDLWELFVPGVGPGQRYAWAVDPDHPLLDPCAVAVDGPARFGEPGMRRSMVVAPPEPIAWQRPRHRLADSVIYELHVRGFTDGGTYTDVAARIDHMLSLGVTAVELLPVHEFNECELATPGLVNFWGYSPIAWNAPMRRYARDNPIEEFRAMVRALHAAGIEVILDVVYNHTGEQAEGHALWHFMDLDPKHAYLRDDDGALIDRTGCGNTVNCGDAWMQRMIVDSLRWWVHGLGVDGFRFDLSTIFTPTLVREIEEDPLLAGVHLIAEPWDAAGGHQVRDWPGNDRWCIWNDSFRDDVRRAWLEGGHAGGTLARRLTGSDDLFAQGPRRSLNFITAHDGFTLADVVAYDRKHNAANGEDGRDGRGHEPSGNHGVEGPTDDPEVRTLRDKARRNLMASLLLAQGVPMLVAGDEFARTQEGNNNAYCHDRWLDWDGIEQDAAFLRFVRGLSRLRHETPHLRRARFHEENEVHWFGPDGSDVDWKATPGRFGYRIDNLIVLINLNEATCGFDLPGGTRWHLVADTAAPAPEDFYETDAAPVMETEHIVLSGRSLVVLREN